MGNKTNLQPANKFCALRENVYTCTGTNSKSLFNAEDQKYGRTWLQKCILLTFLTNVQGPFHSCFISFFTLHSVLLFPIAKAFLY